MKRLLTGVKARKMQKMPMILTNVRSWRCSGFAEFSFETVLQNWFQRLKFDGKILSLISLRRSELIEGDIFQAF